MAQLQPTEPRYDQTLVPLSRALKAIRAAQTDTDALVVALDHLHSPSVNDPGLP
jgi:hypothetical protein